MNDYVALWAAQCAEWDAILAELLEARPGQAVTPYQVTLEQRKRAFARGERLLDLHLMYLFSMPQAT